MHYYEAPILGAARFHPLDLIGACMGHDTDRVLLPDGALPPAFFDLSTGMAGELVQKLATYRLRAAVVVPEGSRHSVRFEEFAREANRSRTLRFFPDRERAAAWLSGGD